MLTVIEASPFLDWPRTIGRKRSAVNSPHGLPGILEAGDVIPRSGGCRKVRWARRGTGRRGGVRIIYFNRLANGEIWLLLVYAKSAQENIPAHILKQIKEEIADA